MIPECGIIGKCVSSGTCQRNRGTLLILVYLVGMIDTFVQLNGLLTAAALVVAFSLLAYIALHNWRNAAARALCVLLASVVVVYGGDILLSRASRPDTIRFLLRAQWLGIALVPAAYLHLAQALRLTNSNDYQRWQWLIWAGYISSGLFFVLALSTDLIVWGGVTDGILNQFRAGPLFWVYVLLLGSSMAWLLRAVLWARRNALTPVLRRRLTRLALTFPAPGMGVFPYLAIGESSALVPQSLILLISALVSMSLTVMMTVMVYSIAFQGMPLPDRLIKYDFTRWGLYGPVVGITIILCIQIVPLLERLLGFPANTLITFAVMIMTVIMPLLISRIRPLLDMLIYRQDRAEIEYLRALPRNTFTRADLRQLLENTLIAVCGALRVETGFVVGPGKDGFTVRALCGSRQSVKRFVAEHPLMAVMAQLEGLQHHLNGAQALADPFWVCDGFHLLPLRSPDGMFLGALGVADVPGTMESTDVMTAEARHLITVLAHQIELALSTVELQERIFDALRGLGPEMQSLQQLTTTLEQATPDSLSALETEVSLQPQFPQLVKDALTHYWGGPKLSDSPLLGLRTVRRALRDHGGSPTRALQAVLRQAINNLRPDEQLDPSAQEWLLYNLLELRFLQGKRIRDVANHLALSESDVYRKQRIAVEEVARQLALMEDGEKTLEKTGE